MSKQDRQGVRTPSQIEQKYNLGQVKDENKQQSAKLSQLIQSLAQCEAKIIRMNETLNNLYPVGSIYISANNIEPSTLFGGSWELMTEGYLVVGTENDMPQLEYLEKCNVWKRIQDDKLAILDMCILDFAILS